MKNIGRATKKRGIGKRGISLVEVIVALTVIVIFSTCATSAAISASNTVSNSVITFEAASLCKDVQAIYTVTKGGESFRKFMLYTYSEDFEKEFKLKSESPITLEHDAGSYIVTATVDSDNKFNVTAKYAGDGKVIFTADYYVPAGGAS